MSSGSKPAALLIIAGTTWLLIIVFRRHVNQDLQPYACLFRRCNNSRFAHKSDWDRHMSTDHSQDWPRKVHATTWYCDLDHKELVQFDKETDWREHMQDLSLHPSRPKPPTASQLDVLVIRKQKIASRDADICPFCESKPHSIAILGDRGNPTDIASLLVSHIAEHVRSLCFLSLPSLGGKPVGDGKSLSNLEEASAKRLRNAGSPPQPPSGIEFLEDISLTFKDNNGELGAKDYEKSPRFEIHPEYLLEASLSSLMDHDPLQIIPDSGPEDWSRVYRSGEVPMEEDELLHKLKISGAFQSHRVTAGPLKDQTMATLVAINDKGLTVLYEAPYPAVEYVWPRTVSANLQIV